MIFKWFQQEKRTSNSAVRQRSSFCRRPRHLSRDFRTRLETLSAYLGNTIPLSDGRKPLL
ncbi:hypothetical protein BJY00DRAFT_275257 [Aspergillus carlsbadensis]|nr:hypothetical protein BJY00DRAFT_275257 [Aspergillus carlsbadensis]